MAKRTAHWQENEEADLSSHPALRDYTLVSLAALLVIAVLLVQEGMGWFGLLPAVVGSVALLAHWGIGPPLVLFLVGGFYVSRRFPMPIVWGGLGDEGELWAEMVLTAALIVYLGGSYRLLSLARQAFPVDARPDGGGAARRLRRWFQPDLDARKMDVRKGARVRSPEAVRSGEVAWLLVSAVIFTILGTLCWLYLTTTMMEPPFRMRRNLAHGWVLVWGIGVVLAAAAAVLGYLKARLASRDEAQLYLQDQLWRQTRSEQSQYNGWWVWGWLRRRKGNG